MIRKWRKRLGSLLVFTMIFMMATSAWALSERRNEVINGEWTFEQNTKFTSTVTFNGVTYTWPAADGTATYQLTTDGSGTLSWAAAGAGAGDTLDEAYDQGGAGAGRSITADTGAVAISNTDADTAYLLDLNASPSSSAALGGMTITVGANSTQDGISFANSGSGYDIDGTGSLWYATSAGLGFFTTANITTLNPTNVGAFTGTGAITLDDGSGTSPNFTFTDGSDETAVFSKENSGEIQVTTLAADGLQVVTGNLRVGNGTPGTVAMDGEDFYVEGDSEFDGTVQFDGTVTYGGSVVIPTLQITTLLNLDEDLDIDFDANDEEVNITTSVSNYAADSAVLAIGFSAAGGQSNNTYAVRLRHTADGDPQDHFLVCEDNGGDDMFKVDSGGAVTAAGTITGTGTITAATLQATTLLDVNEDIDVDFDANDEEANITTSATDYAADSALLTLYFSGAGQDNATYGLRIRHNANGDTQDHFIICEDNNGDGDLFYVNNGGAVGSASTITATGGLSTGSASNTYLYTDTVELSNADIKALRGTPKELVAAGGADVIIEVVSVVLILDYGSEVLTESTDNLVVQYGTSGDDITAAIEMTGFIDQAADTVMAVGPSNPLAANAASDMLNNSVELFNTGDGEFGGNASNDTTITVKVTYRTHTAGL